MRQGTSRNERIMPALNPEFFNLDNRSLVDIFNETKSFAKSVRFEEGDRVHDWSALFEEGELYLDFISDQPASYPLPGTCPPHLALFFSFLKLLDLVRSHYNDLSHDHIKFFYKQLLKQEKRELQPDKLYIFLELNRNTSKLYLPKNTGFLAGTASNKQPITYRTDWDIFINKATVGKVHSILNRKDQAKPIAVFKDINEIELDLLGTTSITTKDIGWFPFGNNQIDHQPMKIGFGIQSQILHLSGGKRTITLTIPIDYTSNTRKDHFSKPATWTAKFSSSEGLFSRKIHKIKVTQDQLVFTIVLSKTDPSLVANDFDENYDPSVPLILLELSDYTAEHYLFWKKLHFKSITIAVKVEGFSKIIVKNDNGLLDPSKAFYPFGFTPSVGSNFFVHAEEFRHKNINKISIYADWKALPENFKTYYEGYKGHTNSLVESIDEFKISLAVYKNGLWTPIGSENLTDQPLFKEDIYCDLPTNEKVDTDHNLNSDSGMLRLTLSAPKKAFGHEIYASVYTKAIMSQLKNQDDPIPNPPYTPVIEKLEIDYEANQVLDLNYNAFDDQSTFMHIEPFGVTTPKFNGNSIPLISDDYSAEGQLFIGISSLELPSQLTLFFEILEENVLDRPDVKWSYLTADGWSKFHQDQILSDTTMHLRKTGIVILNIATNASVKSSKMPHDQVWLRVETSSLTERFDRILNIKTNAVLCILDHSKLPKNHPINQTMPNTISKMVSKKSSIKKITQPYSSFGGRPKEDDLSFYIRTSEKLAHKNRAITSWDVERMVLKQFPQIYQVICSPNYDDTGNQKAGAFHVTLIPSVEQTNGDLIRKPLVTASLMENIKTYLAASSSPHANISVGNPKYVEVKINAEVYFKDHLDAGHFIKKLEKDLKQYLSPWAFNVGQKLELGILIYRSDLIKYIESRPYLDFVASISWYKDGRLVKEDKLYAGLHAILVSSNTHNIKVIDPNDVMCQTNQGISQMIVDINFQVE